jgi:uncharacterized protein (DUF2384 family)
MNFDIDSQIVKAFQRALQAWQLNDEAAGGLIGVAPQVVLALRSEEPVHLSEEVQTRMLMVAHLRTALDIYFSPQLANRWMSLPNNGNLFDGATPSDYVAQHGWPGLYLVLSQVQAWAVGNN